MKKKLEFRKARKISDCIYALSAVLLVYRVMFLGSEHPLAFPLLALALLVFCGGLIVYSMGCRCPKCGKLQPRFNKDECIECHTKLHD